MISSNDFPSLHDYSYEFRGCKCSLYEIGTQLSKKQLKEIVLHLNVLGYPVERLEFFEYGQADTLRHLYIKMKDGVSSIPYFQLDVACWHAIVEAILDLSQKR